MSLARFCSLSVLVALGLGASTSMADGLPGLGAHGAFIEKGQGQRGLAIRFEGDRIYVRVCDDDKCDASSGAQLQPPESARALIGKGVAKPIALAGGKRAALIQLEGGARGRTYSVLVMAPLSPKAEEPVVLYSGWTGGASGDRTTQLDVREDAKKGSEVRLTTKTSLCGNEVTTQIRTLDAKSGQLVDSPAPDPLGSTRGGAKRVDAKVEPSPAKRHRILKARVASSGKAGPLTDGDPSTAWTEDELGVPSHAFVTIDAPPEVALDGLDITLQPFGAIEDLRAPKSLSVVTDSGLFVVSLPEDALARGATTFNVPFASPVQTKCIGVVVDEVYPAPKATPANKDKGKAKEPRTKADPRVFISEVAARTALDAMTLEDLAKSLAGGASSDPMTKLRESVLLAAGESGARAAIAAYPLLDGPGRDRARKVIDAAPCAVQLELYVPLLGDKERQESDRARDRVRRCGDDATKPLLAAFEAAKTDAERTVFAEEAAILAPETTIPKFVERLAAATSASERRLYRRALAKSLVRNAGSRAMGAFLATPDLRGRSLTVRIDVLRALGTNIVELDNAREVFGQAARDANEFRDRYLLLGPAAELARKGDSDAVGFVQTAMSDEDHRLRTRAAEAGAGVEPLRGRLMALLDDERVRVREAALGALVSMTDKADASLVSKLVDLLAKDPWTFVRRAAASAIANAPADAATDEKIGRALELEPLPAVRQDIVKALGARKAVSQTKRIAARAFDRREDLAVRIAAIQALGEVCATDAIDALTELVQRGAVPLFEVDRKLGAAAVFALVRLQPADLDQRLAPVLDERAPGDIRDVARRAKEDARPEARCSK